MTLYTRRRARGVRIVVVVVKFLVVCSENTGAVYSIRYTALSFCTLGGCGSGVSVHYEYIEYSIWQRVL